MSAATLRLSRNEAKTQKDCFEYYPSQWLHYFLNRSKGPFLSTLPMAVPGHGERSNRQVGQRQDQKNANCNHEPEIRLLERDTDVMGVASRKKACRNPTAHNP